MTGDMVDYILEGLNNYLMALAREQIRLAFVQAQKEVEYLQQRTREGIETARANGKQIGRPVGSKAATKKSKEAKKAILKYSKDFNGMMKDVEIMRMLGCARSRITNGKRNYGQKRQGARALYLLESSQCALPQDCLPKISARIPHCHNGCQTQ